MGRNSKLTDRQWRGVDARLSAGESLRAIAKSVGISEAAIRQRNKKPSAAPLNIVPAILSAAIAETSEDELSAIRSSLVAAAIASARTAESLAVLAEAQVAKIAKGDPMESADILQAIAALTKLSNDAGSAGTALLNANRLATGKAGIKDRQQAAAAALSTGRFGARPPPLKVVGRSG